MTKSGASPSLIAIAGPNGAGKSTAGPSLLKETLGVTEFVNADLLPSPEHAIARVADRVRRGGHHVPDAVVRRRYDAGLRNFYRLYRPLATTWRVYDNGSASPPRLVALGRQATETRIVIEETWRRIQQGVEDGQ